MFYVHVEAAYTSSKIDKDKESASLHIVFEKCYNIFLNFLYLIQKYIFLILLLLHLSIATAKHIILSSEQDMLVLRFERKRSAALAKSSYGDRCKAAFRGASPRICGSRQIQYFLRAASASVYHSLRAKIPEFYRIASARHARW